MVTMTPESLTHSGWWFGTFGHAIWLHKRSHTIWLWTPPRMVPLVHVLYLTHAHSLFWDFTHTHTPTFSEAWITHSVCQQPSWKHRHTHAPTRTYSVHTVRATTTSCGHVSACRLLMGNHHGNQCHVMSSRSSGSLPFLFFSSPRKGQKMKEVGEKKNKKVQYYSRCRQKASTCRLDPGVHMASFQPSSNFHRYGLQRSIYLQSISKI